MSLGFLSPLVEAGEGEEDKVRQGLQSGLLKHQEEKLDLELRLGH